MAERHCWPVQVTMSAAAAEEEVTATAGAEDTVTAEAVVATVTAVAAATAAAVEATVVGVATAETGAEEVAMAATGVEAVPTAAAVRFDNNAACCFGLWCWCDAACMVLERNVLHHPNMEVVLQVAMEEEVATVAVVRGSPRTPMHVCCGLSCFRNQRNGCETKKREPKFS